MDRLTTVIAVIFVFGLLVFVHELGHFLAAQATGMRVEEFAIGFGPKIVNYKHGETLYSLRAIPLGGFNKITGMDPDEKNLEGSFYSKSIGARMFVILAGSGMNFLLPIILFFTVFMINGIETPTNQPILGTIMADRPAAAAGLLPGDRIVAINGENVETWPQLVAAIQRNAQDSSSNDTTIIVNFQRETSPNIQETIIVPEFDTNTNRRIIGITPLIEIYKPGFFESMKLSVNYTYVVISRMFSSLGEIVTGKTEADIAGPIGIIKITGEVAQSGIIPLLHFAAFFSVNLAIINLLPIPALDGGHIIVLAIEAIRRKPLSSRVLGIVHAIGFAILISILAFATFNDIMR